MSLFCVPYKFMVTIHLVTSFFLLFGGLFFIIVGILREGAGQDFSSEQFANKVDSRGQVRYTDVSGGLLLIMTSVFGFVWQKLPMKWILLTFIVLMALIVSFYLSTATYFLSQYQITTKQLSTEFCLQEQKYEVERLLAQQAENDFCRTSCQCYITYPFDSSETTGYNFTSNNSLTNAVNFTMCSQFIPTQNNLQAAQYLAVLETVYGCAGWCNSSDIFLFSNVNDGPTRVTDTCYHEVVQARSSNLYEVGVVNFAMIFLMGFIIVNAIQILVHGPIEKESVYPYIHYFNDN